MVFFFSKVFVHRKNNELIATDKPSKIRKMKKKTNTIKQTVSKHNKTNSKPKRWKAYELRHLY